MRYLVACAAACTLLGCASRKTVTIRDNLASLAAYREGGGAWTRLPPSHDGTYQLEVADDFQFVRVASFVDGQLEAEELDATADDGACWVLDATAPGCPEAPPSPSARVVHVTGQMLQAGVVAIGPVSRGSGLATGPWSFDLAVPAGVHDLVAWTPPGPSAGSKVVLRRDLDLASDTTVPDIDLATEGMPLAAVPVTVDGFQLQDVFQLQTTLATPHDATEVATSTVDGAEMVTAAVLPASALEPGESQTVELDASTPGITQTAVATVPAGQALHVTLPPPPCIAYHAVGGRLTAAWCASIDAYDGLALLVITSSASPRYEHVVATRSWLAATHASSLAFDTDVPGFQPGWQLDLGQPYQRSVTTWTMADHVAYTDALAGAGP